ncbi:dihydrolipoyl dehydrogenase [Longirhabdus pacifica]|uniref:dihydrolipoyl dehydrogenase n=1 Tax=Longirhabdus pacifica TaxID=2305227 RepID=UPI001008D67A|nr:dihydrolipoyl dehydrogenase [Longirhabdus pacifica]
MSVENYDIVILGGGIGGYTAAIRASQLGKKVALVEKEKLGGTCLHKGCIPSKSLLRSAEVYSTIKQSEQYGIVTESATLDLSLVQKRKNDIVDKLYTGLQSLMKKNEIHIFEGSGRIIGPSIFSPKSGAIAVELPDGESVTLVGEYTMIATGSTPRTIQGLDIDGETVMTSDEALEMDTLPKSIIIVGGGVIGIEWASMLSDFGVHVTIIESSDRLLIHEDKDISREITRLLKKRGIKVLTNTSIDFSETIVEKGKQVTLFMTKGEKRTEVQAERMLLSIGRVGNVNHLGLENTDVKIDHSFITVNEHFQTTESHIYAIGDCIGGVQLAHAAGHEGIAAVHHMLGEEVHVVDEPFIPRCTYSHPEVASVGYSEEQAKEQGRKVKVGKFPFQAIGKALVQGNADGFVKVIADKETNDLIGVHMIGAHVTDLISEAALAHVLDAIPWEIGNVSHPHPTLSEALGEAMLAVDDSAIGM